MSTKNSSNQKKSIRTSKMGWAFPDGTINAVTDIQSGKWHTISAMWYELTTAGDFLKRDTSGFGANFYFTTANALIVRQNCTVALINVSSGNSTYVNALTNSSTKRALLIAEMILFCKTHNFDGVDLDLETFQTASMSASQWVDFKIMLQEMGDALHAQGLILSIEVPPIWNTASNTESGSGDAWDSANSQGYYRLVYSELNNLPVDRVVIMAYDYQYDYSAGQPNQPLAWLKDILNFAQNNLNEDRIKIIAGLPSAGYSGATAGYSITGRTYTYLIAQTGFSGASRDSSSGEIIWANAGISYALCDDNSIAQKITQCEDVGIFDVALWHIGDNKYRNQDESVVIPDNKKLNTVQIYSKTLTIESPTASEDISMFFTDVAINIIKQVTVVKGSSTPSVTFNVVHGTDRSASGTNLITTPSATTNTTTGASVVAFDNASVSAGSFIRAKTTAQSGTVTEGSITIFYKLA